MALRSRGRDESTSCKLQSLGTSLMSPAPTRPPSSNNTSRSSSRVSTPRTLPSTYSNYGSRSSSSRRTNNTSSQKAHTAYSASRDLRSWSQSRHPGVWERPEPEPPCLVSLEELQQDLTGANGKRKKDQAAQKLEHRRQLQVDKDLQEQQVRDLKKQQWKEKQDWVWKTLEEQREQMEAQNEQGRLEDERQEQMRAKQEQFLLQMEAEEKMRRQLRQPKTCRTCLGSGKCSSCSGSGCVPVTYLSSVVSDQSSGVCGRLLCGCSSCGGRRDGSELLEMDVKKGHGHCLTCKGVGQTRRSDEEVEAALQKLAKVDTSK